MGVLESSTYLGVGGEMVWFLITAVLIVVVVGGGIVLAVRSYEPHRRR